MADELTPITRLEGILAGQDIQPITRLEYFLKQYAGGGGGSGGGALVVNATVDFTTNKATCDKTAGEMWSAAENGDIIVIHFTLAQDGSSTAVSGVAQATFEYYAEEDATPYYAFALAPHPFKPNSSAWRFSADSASDYPEASLM